MDVNADALIDKARRYHPSAQLPPVAAAADISAAEAAVGYAMPPTLRRLYLEVSNGMFDDRQIVFPLTFDEELYDQGHYVECPFGQTVLQVHHMWANGFEPESAYQPYLVPLRFWGCSVWTFVDWRTPEGQTWASDEGHVFAERFTVTERLTRWLDGHEDYPTPA